MGSIIYASTNAALWCVFYLLCLCSLSLIAHAQGAGISGIVIQPGPPAGTGGPAPFATVRVCPGTGSGTPCSPLANLFSDPALTQPVANPFTSDSYGNYSVWTAPSTNGCLVQVTPVNGIVYDYLSSCATGTLTSVGLSMPSIFNVSNSPLTASGGTINVTFANQSPNTVLAACNSVVVAFCPLQFSYPGVFTNTQQNNSILSSIGGANPATWYSQQSGGTLFSTDAITGIAIVPSGSTVTQIDGLSGAVWNNATSTPFLGGGVNGVGVYALCKDQVSNSACWGMNSVSMDSTGTSGTLVLGYEADLNLFGSPNRFQGIYLTGLALAGTLPPGPTIGNANGVESRSSLVEAFFPPGNSFPAGLVWCRGCVSGPGVQLDGTCFSGSCNSQSITMTGYDAGGNPRTTSLVSDVNGNIDLTPAATQAVVYPSVAFASLNNISVPNGGMVYCSNCQNVVDNGASPGAACLQVISGGGGSMARRENNRWDCN